MVIKVSILKCVSAGIRRCSLSNSCAQRKGDLDCGVRKEHGMIICISVLVHNGSMLLM